MQHRIAAVAGRGQLQLDRRTGVGRHGVRVQVRDHGQPAERRGTAIVQPVARVERLRDFGIRRQRDLVGVEYARHVQVAPRTVAIS